jgi:hypothetical protein
LAQITDKKAKLADEWVVSNMEHGKYKELQLSLNKEEMRLKSLRANIHPSRFTELEGVNETLRYLENQFHDSPRATKDNGGGLKLLEKIKPKIMIAGLKDIDSIECVTPLLLIRQVLKRLQVNFVVFKDRIEIRCQIPYESYKSINAIMTLGL